MAKNTLVGLSLLLLGIVSTAPYAVAQATLDADAAHTLSAVADIRAFTDDRGTLSSFTVEEKFVTSATTILVAPTIGERSTPSATYDALGIRGTIYEDWSPTVSTRTTLFVAEKMPVFAHTDVAQDITLRVADRTTVTAGIRWAEYFEERDVAFASLGVRRYFDRGSIAYRLTGTQVDGKDKFLAHLVNLRLNDGQGDGNTQLWLSVGDASSSQLDANFSGSDRGFMLQRTQPLWGDVALVAAAGLSSYASPGGRYMATTLSIGLSTKLD
jgi:YaiO family outer membrane protein